MIKALLTDAPLLSDYLHDGSFFLSHTQFDTGNRQFLLKLKRICYENPDPCKVLFFFSGIRYPFIQAMLTITEAHSVVHKWQRHPICHSDGPYPFIEIEYDDDYIKILSYILCIEIGVSQNSRIFVQDISAPLCQGITDIGGTMCLDEIEKLRSHGNA
jgi:hypothetical protein